MKSIVTEGTVDIAPCSRCQKLVEAYYSYGPVEHNGQTVEDVLRVLCNQCGDVITTTPQSAHRFHQNTTNRKSKRSTFRIPQELHDFISTKLSSAGADLSNSGLYLTALLLACHGRERELGPAIVAAKSPVLSRPNKIAVTLYIGPQLLETLVGLAKESQISNTSELLRRLLVLADDHLERDVNHEFKRLVKAYA